MQEHPSRFNQQLEKYCVDDILNADEFGQEYQMASMRTIDRSALPVRENNLRSTYLACANADDAENFSLIVIGK